MFKFLGTVFFIMGIGLFMFCILSGVGMGNLLYNPMLSNENNFDSITLLTNPLFYLILGIACWLMIVFERYTDKLIKGEKQ